MPLRLSLKKLISLRRTILCGAGVLFLTTVAWAQKTKEFAVKGVGQQDIYLVAVKAEGGTSDLKPGIYALSGDKTTPLLLGDVLGTSRSFNGILETLAITRYTARNEALAVVDGKLTLFTSHTKPTSGESFIAFGSAANPVIDVMSRRTVKVEPITDIANVAVKSMPLQLRDMQIVVASVKQPTGFAGTGLTFAFLLRQDRNDAKGPVTLIDKAVVLDYEFYPANELERFAVKDNSYSLLSISHLNALSNPQDSDDKILESWRLGITAYLRKLKSGKEKDAKSKDAFNRDTVPFYDLFDANLQFTEYPRRVILEEPVLVVQKMNPVGDGSGVYFASPDDDDIDELVKKRPQVIGQVDYNDRRGTYDFHIINGHSASKDNDESTQAILIYINNIPHIAYYSESAETAVTVPLSTGIIPEDLNHFSGVHLFSQDAAGGGELHYFVLSYGNTENGRTTSAFAVREVKGVARFERVIELNRRFIPQNELVARLHQEDKKILFDDITASSTVVRRNRPKLTTPLLDLGSSSSDRPVQVYLAGAALKTHTLGAGLEYRKYDETGAKESQSGFYYADNTRVPFIEGELLQVAGAPEDKFSLDTKAIKDIGGSDDGTKAVTEEERQAIVSIYPFRDSDAKADENKFNVLCSLYSSESANSSAEIHTIPMNFKRLTGVKIVQARRGRKSNVTVLYFFSADKKKEQTRATDNGGVYAVNFNLSFAGVAAEKIVQISGRTQQWVQKNIVNPTALKKSIVPDVKGDLYWITTPELERQHRHFSVIKLADTEEKALYPNRPGERVVLRHNEELEDDDYSSLLVGNSKWLIYSRMDIEKHFPWFKDFADKRYKLEQEKGKEGIVNTAQLLGDFDQHLETIAKPGADKVHEVILVEENMKEQFMKAIMEQYAFAGHTWSGSNLSFELYMHDPLASYRELGAELDRISRPGDSRRMLLAQLGAILTADNVEVKTTTAPAAEAGAAKNEKPDGDKGDDDDDDDEKTKKAASDDQRAAAAKALDEEEDDDDDDDNDGGEEEKKTPAAPARAQDDERYPYSRMMALAAEGRNMTPARLRTCTDCKNIPMLIVATPAEWRALHENFDKEADAGAFSKFKLNSRFLTSSWSVWPPSVPSKASKEVVDLARVPISKDEYGVFPSLERILEQTVNQEVAPQHRLIIVPDELKPLIRKLVLSRWAADPRIIQGPWSHVNPNLSLFQITTDKEAVTQEKVAENFEAMNGSINGGRRPVVIADMAEILRVGRPRSDGRPFTLRDPSGGKGGGVGALQDDDGKGEGEVNNRPMPHLMWYLASEGKKIQPGKTRDWSIGQDVKPQVPMLIFASPRELDQLEQDTAFEGRFTQWRKEFASETLDVPTFANKVNLIEDLMRRPEIASLNYNFNHNSLPSAEARRQLIGVMIGRIEQIARMLKVDPTNAFLKTYSELRRVLTQDSRLRQERQIDRFFFERLYRRVFPMPLSFDILRNDDPLLKLRDPDRAAIALQEIGYEGSTDMKRTLIETITSQTKGTDEGRKIPSSTILFGTTSTGKTFLFEKMMQLMGLEPFNFDKPNDEKAGYIKINVGTLVEAEDPLNPNKMSVHKMIQYIEHFISLPNGFRGHICFDDAHKGTANVRKEIIAFVQKFFEAEGGMLRVRRNFSEKKEYVDVPVRNLNLWMTLNPQPDKEIREKFVDDDDTIDQHIIAALAGDGVQIDDSFVARWALKLNLDKFPREAKLPSLVTRIRNGSQQEFSSNPRLMLVSPEVLDLLSDTFPNANAREFLSTATAGILSLDNDAPPAPIYIVRPRDQDGEQEDLGPSGRKRKPPRETADSRTVREKLKQITAARPITNGDMSSKVELMSFVLDGFRSHVYNAFVNYVQQAPLLNRDANTRRTEMPALVLGAVNNVVEFKSVPLDHVRVQPEDLGAKRESDRVEFQETVSKLSVDHDTFFRLKFHSVKGDSTISLADFLHSSTPSTPSRQRLDVLAETAGEAEAILSDLMATYFRTDSVQRTTSVEDWAAALKETDPKAAFKEASEKLVKLYFEFSSRLYARDLAEMANDFGTHDITDYDRARLFFMCVDKAITQLPWGQWSNFLLAVYTQAANDLSFGLIPALQHFTFLSPYSPVSTATYEVVRQSAEGNREFREFKPREESLVRHFNLTCTRAVMTATNAGGTNGN